MLNQKFFSHLREFWSFLTLETKKRKKVWELIIFSFKSEKAGGGIYIYNNIETEEKELTYSISFTGLRFEHCENAKLSIFSTFDGIEIWQSELS